MMKRCCVLVLQTLLAIAAVSFDQVSALLSPQYVTHSTRYSSPYPSLTQRLPSSTTAERKTPTILFNRNDEEAETPEPQQQQREKSVLEKLNDALDVPILDANNKSDQGPIAETLKSFVRGQPEVASVTFSVLVIVGLIFAIRSVNYFLYNSV